MKKEIKLSRLQKKVSELKEEIIALEHAIEYENLDASEQYMEVAQPVVNAYLKGIRHRGGSDE